ncbi:sensor histidine kinase [Arenibacter sp. N53]|nr:sensor histidine kinase [Arenibacter sp. N53]
MFIVILIAHSVLGQLTTDQALETHDRLTTKIEPAVALLNDIRTANKELYLLVANKVIDHKNSSTSNRIKQIIEVDLPYFISNMVLLKKSLEPTDPRNKNIDTVAGYASKSILLIEEINSLLLTSKDYEDPIKIDMTTDLLNNRLSVFSTEIDNGISFLLRKYKQELENKVAELSNELQSNSRFFLLTSLLFIGFGVVITYRNTRAIVKPINALMNSVRSIQEGNYENKVSIKGNDEFSMLGTAFNQMSESLKSSFDQINTKNKELEQFVYIASHDLQEPLRTVNSFTDLLEKDYKDKLDETAAIYINFISQASHRMSLLVKGLLDYSRIGGNKELTKVKCNEMLDALKDDLSTLISTENATLEVGILPELGVYKIEFRLLFQNLINNAIKFHKPGIPPIVKITAAEEKDFWKFKISDNGIGIKENQKDKIFGMFQRLNTQKEFAGTGIGLAHCVKIIEMHGGTITVESEFGRGSTFCITISKKLI